MEVKASPKPSQMEAKGSLRQPPSRKKLWRSRGCCSDVTSEGSRRQKAWFDVQVKGRGQADLRRGALSDEHPYPDMCFLHCFSKVF